MSTTVIFLICLPVLCSVLWVAAMEFGFRREKQIAKKVIETSGQWHYCDGCGAYVDPSGNPHQTAPREFKFNTSDKWIKCGQHNTRESA